MESAPRGDVLIERRQLGRFAVHGDHRRERERTDEGREVNDPGQYRHSVAGCPDQRGLAGEQEADEHGPGGVGHRREQRLARPSPGRPVHAVPQQISQELGADEASAHREKLQDQHGREHHHVSRP